MLYAVCGAVGETPFLRAGESLELIRSAIAGQPVQAHGSCPVTVVGYLRTLGGETCEAVEGDGAAKLGWNCQAGCSHPPPTVESCA